MRNYWKGRQGVERNRHGETCRRTIKDQGKATSRAARSGKREGVERGRLLRNTRAGATTRKWNCLPSISLLAVVASFHLEMYANAHLTLEIMHRPASLTCAYLLLPPASK